jgi:ABC-2 type transport system ATP-binding protein
MEEAERCNRLAFLNHGNIVAQGTPDEIRNLLTDRQVFSIRIPYNPELIRPLLETDGIQLVNQFGNELRIITSASITVEQLQKIIDKHYNQFKVTLVRPDIEDAFMALTDSGVTQ